MLLPCRVKIQYESQLVSINLNGENMFKPNAVKEIIVKLQEQDMRQTLSDVLSQFNMEEPFTVPSYLYHITTRGAWPLIQKTGLVPSQPQSSTQTGSQKGELFEGVWLTNLKDLDSVIDEFMLPESYYSQGVLLRVETSGLAIDEFIPGIEMYRKPEDHLPTRDEYFKFTKEIIYTNIIPPEFLTEVN